MLFPNTLQFRRPRTQFGNSLDLEKASLGCDVLGYRLTFPDECSSWVHEEEIKRDRKQQRGRLPDAMVNKSKVVEFGGAYKKEKLLAFHKFCEARGLEYEVW
jgi:hypothetical protein